MMRPLTFAAAVLGFLLVATLAFAILVVWAGSTGFVRVDFYLPTGDDGRSETYDLVAGAGQLILTAQFGLLHVLAALFCATHAHTLRGSLLAGWTFVVGASIAFVAHVGGTVSLWIEVQSMAERPINYLEPEPWVSELATTQTVLAIIYQAGYVVMLAGWLLLVIAAVRRAK